MHYHVPKPFYRKSRDTWYVEVDGRQINLGKDREAAFQRYHAIMAAPPEVRPTHAIGTGEGLKLTELFDRFLDWVKQHRSPDTYVWYQYRLQRFADRFPDLTMGQLRPYPRAGMGGQFSGSQSNDHPELHAVRQTLHQMGADAGIY